VAGASTDREAFLDGFMTGFFSVGGELAVSEEQRQQALGLARVARDEAVVGCIEAFGTTDFRGDLGGVSVSTLVIHGDSDGIVPFAVSGQRSAEAIQDSVLVLVEGAPHGFNVSHAERFNQELIGFLSS
jgi:pimeloyl-ACP methyl ester carboxylesterase